MELKNAKDGITVHVYPVYFLETPDFDAKTILDLVYGANIKTESLKVFSDESYKTADGNYTHFNRRSGGCSLCFR